MILELCKSVHCVDLAESFQTHIYLQNLASIQPRTSPVKFACSEASTAGQLRLGGCLPEGTFSAGGPRSGCGDAGFRFRLPERRSRSRLGGGNTGKSCENRKLFLQFFSGLVLGCIKKKFQKNMRLTSFFKLYKICILLHRCNLKHLAKTRFEKSASKFL